MCGAGVPDQGQYRSGTPRALLVVRCSTPSGVAPSTLGPVQCVPKIGRHVVSRNPSATCNSSGAEETLNATKPTAYLRQSGHSACVSWAPTGSVEACSSIARTTPIAAQAGVRGFSIGTGSPKGAVVDVSGFRIAIALAAFLLSAVGLSMRWFGRVI
jgi:hypothetical protein